MAKSGTPGAAAQGGIPRRFRLRVGDESFVVEVQQTTSGALRVLVNDQPIDVYLEPLTEAGPPPPPVPDAGMAERPGRADPPDAAVTPSRPAADGKRVLAPMPGRVVSISVKAGSTVAAGDEVCLMETMKMQQSLRATASGVVRAVHVQPAQVVTVGQVLIEIE